MSGQLPYVFFGKGALRTGGTQLSHDGHKGEGADRSAILIRLFLDCFLPAS